MHDFITSLKLFLTIFWLKNVSFFFFWFHTQLTSFYPVYNFFPPIFEIGDEDSKVSADWIMIGWVYCTEGCRIDWCCYWNCKNSWIFLMGITYPHDLSWNAGVWAGFPCLEPKNSVEGVFETCSFHCCYQMLWSYWRKAGLDYHCWMLIRIQLCSSNGCLIINYLVRSSPWHPISLRKKTISGAWEYCCDQQDFSSLVKWYLG